MCHLKGREEKKRCFEGFGGPANTSKAFVVHDDEGGTGQTVGGDIEVRAQVMCVGRERILKCAAGDARCAAWVERRSNDVFLTA